MTERRHHCFNCGEDIGAWDRFCEQLDTCGKPACNREASNAHAQERGEAHERLERDMGYGW